MGIVSFGWAAPSLLGVRDTTRPPDIGSSTNTAPSLGPLFGGLLAGRLGWRAIFWFLSVASASCLLAILFALPETSRKLVGNGSIEAVGIHRLPFTKFYDNVGLEQTRISPSSRRLRLPNPLTCIRCLLRKDTAIIVFVIGILYTIYSCLQASLSSLFIGLYGLNELQAGLIYLPFGLGCAAAAYFTGKSSKDCVHPTRRKTHAVEQFHRPIIGSQLPAYRDFARPAHRQSPWRRFSQISH